MADEVHEVVKLLLARMDSHPDEFLIGTTVDTGEKRIMSTRWGNILSRIQSHLTEEEKTLLDKASRAVAMTAAHEAALDELFNGPARRQDMDAQTIAISQQRAVVEQQLASHSYASITGKTANTTFIDEYAFALAEKFITKKALKP